MALEIRWKWMWGTNHVPVINEVFTNHPMPGEDMVRESQRNQGLDSSWLLHLSIVDFNCL